MTIYQGLKNIYFLRGVTVLGYENDDTPVNLHSINEMLPELKKRKQMLH